MTMNENDRQTEPVACIGTNGELAWIKKPNSLYSKPLPLYTHPAPAFAQEPLGWRVAFTKAPRGNFQEGQPDDSTREYWRKQGVGFEYCYAQPPAEVVRELKDQLQRMVDFVTTGLEVKEDHPYVEMACAALKSAKEHGL